MSLMSPVNVPEPGSDLTVGGLGKFTGHSTVSGSGSLPPPPPAPPLLGFHCIWRKTEAYSAWVSRRPLPPVGSMPVGSDQVMGLLLE